MFSFPILTPYAQAISITANLLSPISIKELSNSSRVLIIGLDSGNLYSKIKHMTQEDYFMGPL